MKIKVLMSLLMVTFLALLPVACKAPEVTTTPPTTTPPTTPPTTTRPATEPPSVEELTKGHFALPEIPRITCELLKQMMDRGDVLVLVDARAQWGFKGGYLPGAINIPNELVPPALPEEMEEAPIELMKLMMLPKDKLVIFYCD